METRLNGIIGIVENVEYVKITQPFVLVGETIKGEIEVNLDSEVLSFGIEILPHYPFQYHDIETVRFVNSDLLEYDHVNADGSICVHTLHSPDLKTKLELDLHSLKQWILKYYLKKEKDTHYEHIMVLPAGTGKNEVLWFTDVPYDFQAGEFGQFHFSLLSTGYIKKEETRTFILQDFKIGRNKIECAWSGYYKRLQNYLGVFVFLEKPPVENKRFAIKNWQDLAPYVSQDFLKYLYDFETTLKTNKAKFDQLKLIIGYKTDDAQIHWQCINISKGDFPSYALKTGPGTYEGNFYDKPIDWLQTRNCSPQYFFGRGALSPKITKSKILILGIGAIGSILSATLVRGGCTNIFLNDHDVKEPDNVCRSEYQFSSGMVAKVYELHNHLSAISPFVEIDGNQELSDVLKLFNSHTDWKPIIEEALNQYDFIFDCTTDNDLAYIFSQLNLTPEVVNLSITNHANELVCVFKPGQYNWVMQIFASLNNDIVDLYNPTGCWSPTFKAGYNDIAMLVHYAVKQINLALLKDRPFRNFYLSTSEDSGFEIKLNEF
ncbi:MAG: ThiF family adenylyltransferase [Mucilaginibacter sp.]